MYDIILQHLMPCHHIPILHRHKINKVDPYLNSVEYFLDLTPEVMKHTSNSVAHEQIQPVSKTIGANWNHYALHQGESLYSNYHAYLFDARNKIMQCKNACDLWSNLYKYQKMPNSNNLINKRHQQQEQNQQNDKSEQNSKKIVELIKNFLEEFSLDENSLTILNKGQNAVSNNMNNNNVMVGESEKSSSFKQLDSLQSLGESSGYESFKYRPDDEDDIENGQDNEKQQSEKDKESWIISSQKEEKLSDLDLSEDLFRQGSVSLGKFDFCEK